MVQVLVQGLESAQGPESAQELVQVLEQVLGQVLEVLEVLDLLTRTILLLQESPQP